VKVINLHKLEGLTRRAFLGIVSTGIASCVLEAAAQDELPVLKKNRIGFEKAVKGTDRDKIRYLDQVLVDEYKLVRDAKRNPDGIVKAFYYWPDREHKRRAADEISEQARASADTKESYLASVEKYLPRLKLWPRVEGRMGVGKTAAAKSSFILIDKSLFELQSEDELLSQVDFGYRFLHVHENNIPVNGAPINMKNQLLNSESGIFTQLDASRHQIELILTGKRKNISDAFYRNALGDYLRIYGDCQNKLVFYDKNRFFEADGKQFESSTFAEAYETTKSLLADLDARFTKLGYLHKKDKDAWTLEKK
jgi:hypothetical protein